MLCSSDEHTGWLFVDLICLRNTLIAMCVRACCWCGCVVICFRLDTVSFAQLMRWWMDEETQAMIEDSQHVYDLCARWEIDGSLDRRAVVAICAASDVQVSSACLRRV